MSRELREHETKVRWTSVGTAAIYFLKIHNHTPSLILWHGAQSTDHSSPTTPSVPRLVYAFGPITRQLTCALTQ